MGFLSSAGQKRIFDGYFYQVQGQVLQCSKQSDTVYHGLAQGGGKNIYTVSIDIARPRKSRCTCPFAAKGTVICKHMAALYFAAFPQEAEAYYREMMADWEEEEQRWEDDLARLMDYVKTMSREDLQQALLQILVEGPEWQYQKFFDEHIEARIW